MPFLTRAEGCILGLSYLTLKRNKLCWCCSAFLILLVEAGKECRSQPTQGLKLHRNWAEMMLPLLGKGNSYFYSCSALHLENTVLMVGVCRHLFSSGAHYISVSRVKLPGRRGFQQKIRSGEHYQQFQSVTSFLDCTYHAPPLWHVMACLVTKCAEAVASHGLASQ